MHEEGEGETGPFRGYEGLDSTCPHPQFCNVRSLGTCMHMTLAKLTLFFVKTLHLLIVTISQKYKILSLEKFLKNSLLELDTDVHFCNVAVLY